MADDFGAFESDPTAGMIIIFFFIICYIHIVYNINNW